jgi:hypothetical protein
VVTTATDVYVTGISSAALAITVDYDLQTGHQRWTAATGAIASDGALLALSPDNKHAYVTTENGEGISIVAYDAGTGAVLWHEQTPVPPPIGPVEPGRSHPISIAATSTSVIVVQTAVANMRGAWEADAYAADGANGQAVQLWTSSDVPPTPSAPHAARLSPDGSSLYIVGELGNSTSWLVVALDTTTGNVRWRATPPGEWISSLAVSPDGQRVYVTGLNPPEEVVLALSSSDGSQVWAASSAPAPDGTSLYQASNGDSLAVTPEGGTVLVVGDDDSYYTNEDYHTQYTIRSIDAQSGVWGWEQTLPAPDDSGGYVARLVTSADGSTLGLPFNNDVYGLSTSGGHFTWHVHAGEAAGLAGAVSVMNVAGSGFVVAGSAVATNATSEYLTQALDATTGASRWVSTFSSGDGGFGELYGSASSPDGTTLYLTGATTDGSNVLALTIAADAHSGAERWRSTYRPSTGSEAQTFSVAVSADGSRVYAVGQEAPTPNHGDVTLVIAYDARTGAQLWTSLPGGYGGDGVAVARDGSSVYIAGDHVIASINSTTGTARWTVPDALTTPAGTLAIYPYAVALSPDGQRFAVTGSASGYGTTVLATSDGAALWSSSFACGCESSSNSDTARSVAFAPDGGSVVVTGGLRDDTTGEERFGTVSYDAHSGAQRWSQVYSNGLWDEADALAVAPDGSAVYVTGASGSAPTSPNGSSGLYCGLTSNLGCKLDFATVAYSLGTGSQLWFSRFATAFNGWGSAIAVSADGSTIYAAGSSESPEQEGTSNVDSMLLAYDSSGNAVWSGRWEDPGAEDDLAGLTVSRDGSGVQLGVRAAGPWAIIAVGFDLSQPAGAVPEAPLPALIALLGAAVALTRHAVSRRRQS